MYQKRSIGIFIVVLLFLATGCISEFEKIRRGNDYELKYQKALEFYEQEEWYKAQVLLEQITGVFRGSEKLEKIYFYYAYTHYNLEKYILAAHYFKNFANTFPNSEFAEEARFMNAYSNYQLSPNHRLDQGNTADAIEAFQIFVNTHPKSERVAEANRLMDQLRYRLEEKAFAEADLYYKLSDYKAANHTYKNVIKEFPDAGEVERARFMIVKSSYKLAQNSIDLVKEERFDETIEAYKEFKDRHPNSEYIGEAEGIYNSCVQNIEKLN